MFPAGSYRLLVPDANSCPIDTILICQPPCSAVGIATRAEDICEGGAVQKLLVGKWRIAAVQPAVEQRRRGYLFVEPAPVITS